MYIYIVYTLYILIYYFIDLFTYKSILFNSTARFSSINPIQSSRLIQALD